MSNDFLKEPTLNHLLNILQSDTASDDTLCDVAYALVEIGDQKAIEPLIRRLVEASDSPWVRRELITALGSIILLSETYSQKAVDLHLEILSSSEPEEVKEMAILNLGFIDGDEAVDQILKILESNQTGLTYACVEALGNLGDPRALDPLTEALESEKLLVPQTAAKGLGKLGKSASKALPALQELAERGNDAERRYALEAIAKIEGR